MIYSRFLQAPQKVRSLPTTSDLNHRLNVRVTDLATPIVVSYRLHGVQEAVSSNLTRPTILTATSGYPPLA